MSDDEDEAKRIDEIVAAVGEVVRDSLEEGQPTAEIIKRVTTTLEEYLEDDEVADED